MIKIIFFDVDGTLLRMGEKNISDKTLYALKALKKKGILLCMATGRKNNEEQIKMCFEAYRAGDNWKTIFD